MIEAEGEKKVVLKIYDSEGRSISKLSLFGIFRVARFRRKERY